MIVAAPRLAAAELVWALSLDNRMVVFYHGAPETILREVQITGLEAGETVRAIDFRPLDSQLYGLTSSRRIVRIHMLTGVAKPIGPSIPVGQIGDEDGVGFDFNPVTDEIRIVTSESRNFRISPSTGQMIDGNPALPGVQGDSNS